MPLHPASLIGFNAPQGLAPNGTTALTAYLPTAIPEPTTLVLVGVALAAWVLRYGRIG